MKKIKLFLFAAMLLGSVGLHASNTITYTATAKLPGFYGSLEVGMTIFGPKIVSHTFDNGIGTITFDGNVTKIAEYAFRECDGLTSIEIPKSVTIIKNDAFYNCYGLVDIIIPNSVTTIENHAFYGCSALPSITIPQSVTTIEKWAFTNCYSLTSVNVFWTDEKSIPSIDSNVFSEIADHKGPSGAILFIPEGTEELYRQADVWKDFGSIVEYGIITYTATSKLSGDNGSLDVGKTTFGPAIISHEFSNGTGTITCNGEITTIGEEAFYYCTGLTSITIPNSVTTIGDYAFSRCSGLTSVTIGNSVTTIGERAFAYCRGLTSITIPNSVTTIGYAAFDDCSGLTSITIPNSVTTIESYAFAFCSGLTVVSVSWTDEKSIPSIYYSNVFEEIAHGAGPSGAKLYVPYGTKELYQQANVWNTFGDIESDITKINDLWYRLLNVRTANVIVNQGTTATGERIPYTSDIIINKTEGSYSIAAIEDSAFYNAKLTSLTVLTDIPLPCEQYTFLGQDKSIPVYVLDVDAFKRAQYWSKFTNIQFYAPYRDEAKQKLIDAANSVPNEHSAEAKAIAEAYGKKMDGLNTAAAIDKLYAQAMEEIQAFMDEALWTLDKTGCMTLPKP